MSVATNDWGVRGKIHCDVTSKSFDGDGIANLLHADDGINSTVTFNISGKVIVDGYTTQANTKVDAIEFTLTQNGYDLISRKVGEACHVFGRPFLFTWIYGFLLVGNP